MSGSFVIGSEADVAALCLRGDWIVGDLLLDPGPWSRAGLRCIRGVEGRLELDLTDAVGLEGLDRVIRVGELGLIGEGEPELTALSGLLSVDAVGLEVDTTETLRLAPALSDLGDLNIDSPALRFVLPRWPIRSLGSLEVAWGGTLLDLDAIGDVEHIDGDVILYRLSQKLDGLQRLEEVEGDLVLSGVLHNTVTSLQRLRRVGGRFGLERLGGALIIDEDDPLPAGIDALREAGAIEVRTFFPGPIAFPNLERIGRLDVHSPTYGRDFADLVATDMPALQEATTIEIGLTEGLGRISMPALHTVTADLTVGGAQAVALLDLDALELVGGQLWLQHLSSVPALALPRLREVGGDLRFSQSGSLSHLSMPSLERVVGALVLDGNPRLTELSGLEQLRALGGLSFADNDRLEALPALPGLEALEVDLLLDHNLGLEQLSGLSALREVGGALPITSNRSLSLDEIDARIEGLDAAPAGGSTVSGNGR